MRKSLILLLLLPIFLILQVSFVSASICKGSDGYFHECGYTYTTYHNTGSGYQKTVINLDKKAIYDSSFNRYDKRYDNRYYYNDRRPYSNRNRYDDYYDDSGIIYLNKPYYKKEHRTKYDYDDKYYPKNRNVIYIKSSNKRYDGNYKYDRRYDSTYNRYDNDYYYDHGHKHYNLNKKSSSSKYYYTHPYLQRNLKFLYEYDSPRDYPTHYLHKYTQRDYKYGNYRY